MYIPVKEYITEINSPALIGPGLRTDLPEGVRRGLHIAFTTFRYLTFYLFFKPMAWLTIHAVCRLKTHGLEYLPRPGQGGIGVCNHLSNFDPVLHALYAPRPSWIMTKAEYFKTPLLGGAAMIMGGFPVRRGEADRQAIKTALTAIKRGGVLSIFPEGTRSKSYKLQEAHPGAAMLAATSGAAVWPVAIWGTEYIMRRRKWGFLRRPEVHFVIGAPFNLKEAATAFATAHHLPPTGKRGRHDDLDFLSDILMLKLAEQLPPEYQGEFTAEGVVARHLSRHNRAARPEKQEV